MSESSTETDESTSSTLREMVDNLQRQQELVSGHLEVTQGLLENLQFLNELQGIAQSLDRLLEQASAPTMHVPGNEPTPQPVVEPQTEIPASATADQIILPDGRSVPSAVVRALAEYDENVWAGALNPKARAAIAHVVIKTLDGDQQPVLRTNYPFCLDPNPGNLSYESPCILRADHPGKHRDNNDGVW
jgi:hypothetical protein